MGNRRNGRVMDFILCCFIAVLFINVKPIRTLHKLFALAIVAILSLCFFVGFNITLDAFLASLPAINKNVGEVVFTALVLIITLIWKYLELQHTRAQIDVLDFIGKSLIVSVVLWAFIFAFEIGNLSFLALGQSEGRIVAYRIQRVPYDWNQGYPLWRPPIIIAPVPRLSKI